MFTDLKLTHQENEMQISTWKHQLSFRDGFPCSVQVGQKEILAAPIRLLTGSGETQKLFIENTGYLAEQSGEEIYYRTDPHLTSLGARYALKAWEETVHRRYPYLEKEMVTHSNILAWKTPCREKPAREQSIGSLKHQR